MESTASLGFACEMSLNIWIVASDQRGLITADALCFTHGLSIDMHGRRANSPSGLQLLVLFTLTLLYQDRGVVRRAPEEVDGLGDTKEKHG